MIPTWQGVDHIHVYVSDRAAAEQWYREVLGFRRVAAFEEWATATGPLTLEDPAGKVHLALFQSDAGPNSTLALGATAAEFMAWKAHLEAAGLVLRISDHDLAWSLYFSDPWDNAHEITSYEHETIRAQLG